jgi:SNF2 family DNA or RNA helicase
MSFETKTQVSCPSDLCNMLDMGLGKTFQTCTLLAGLMRSRTISSALIVCPVAVMKMWEREAQMIVEKYCGVRVSIRIVDSSIRRERRAMLLDEALRW